MGCKTAMQTLKDMHEEMQRRLGHIGHVVIAGGAVRDAMLDRPAKDYDVFLLAPHMVDKAMAVTAMNTDYVRAPNGAQYGLTMDMVGAWVIDGHVVQVMFSDYRTLHALLGSFDWNISQFGIGAEGIVRVGQLPKQGDTLVLKNWRWPFSTLCRGVKFSKRFGMRLRALDVDVLAHAISVRAYVGYSDEFTMEGLL